MGTIRAMRGSRHQSEHSRSLRVLVAPAPYKECLGADLVADAIAAGVLRVSPATQLTKLPLCDGGTGIVDRFIESMGGRRVECIVRNPLMEPIDSYFGIMDDGTAVIESAKAAGLALVPAHSRNPFATTTWGVGDLIREAYQQGCQRIIVGCGDSATNDGGVGMAQALGVRFLDEHGVPIGQGGGELHRIRNIDTSELCISLSEVQVIVACNLTSILCGPEGTSRRYAPQKGASPEQVSQLEQAIDQYADVLAEHLGWDLRYLPGTGGAGGLGAGLLAFLDAELRFSMQIVSEVLGVERFLEDADLVITGEGTVDLTSATGKAPCSIGLMARKYGIPTVSIVGSIGDDVDIVYFHGLDMVESIVKRPASLDELMQPRLAQALIEEASSRVMRFIDRRSLHV